MMKIRHWSDETGRLVYEVVLENTADVDLLREHKDCNPLTLARIASLEHDHKLMREALKEVTSTTETTNLQRKIARTALDKLEVKDE